MKLGFRLQTPLIFKNFIDKISSSYAYNLNTSSIYFRVQSYNIYVKIYIYISMIFIYLFSLENYGLSTRSNKKFNYTTDTDDAQ